MRNSRRMATIHFKDLIEAQAVKIHSDACDECRQKYREIVKHIEELEKDANKGE